MDWSESYNDAQEMVEAINDLLDNERLPIKFVNLRYTLYNKKESSWLYHVKINFNKGRIVISHCETEEVYLDVAANELERLRIRPYYHAVCVGFKNFIFTLSQEKR